MAERPHGCIGHRATLVIYIVIWLCECQKRKEVHGRTNLCRTKVLTVGTLRINCRTKVLTVGTLRIILQFGILIFFTLLVN